MRYLRWLLFPFSLIYGLVVIIRNWCYDRGIFTTRKFKQPVICIGNLEVGGTGKTPMAEYLIRLLKDNRRLAVLSRGYGRETKGYVLASAGMPATQVGDEPSQFKQKFPEITVAVCEKRVDGLEALLPANDVVLLDDAYQHRAVKAGLNILLFDYNRLKQPHLLLPAGNMREPFGGRKRAEIMIVTKCPSDLSAAEQISLLHRLKPYAHQQIFCTSINYLPLQDMSGQSTLSGLDSDTTVFLLTGIANPKPLLQYINRYTLSVIHHNYPDHHQFSLKNIAKLADDYRACTARKKMIITTEKDAQRLRDHQLLPLVEELPVNVVPIGIKFLSDGAEPFNQLVNNYVSKHTTHHHLDQEPDR